MKIFEIQTDDYKYIVVAEFNSQNNEKTITPLPLCRDKTLNELWKRK